MRHSECRLLGSNPSLATMNKLNAFLSIILIFLVLYWFWPDALNSLFRSFIDKSFLVQVLAVALGVFGGMWADKKLQEHEEFRRIVGALEVIDAELQSNIKASTDIKDAINTRPSYVDRSRYPSNKIIEMAKEEEQWVADISKQIVDKGYYTILSVISTVDNRKLFEKIVNAYLKLRDTQLVLKLAILNTFTGTVSYSEEQKKDIIKGADQHFNKLSDGLAKLKENLKDTDKAVIDEEKKLLDRFKL